MKIAFFGSSLVSAYWNGAATYYRGLLKAMAARGHDITFYEPDAFERQQHRDIEDPDWARIVVYPASEQDALAAVQEGARADVLVKASGVGVFDAMLEEAVLEKRRRGALTVFWDVDAPATLQRLADDARDPFHELLPDYDLVMTYGGGRPVVEAYTGFGARACVPIYNALDPEEHCPAPREARYAADLVFVGNRLPDREARVAEFFFEPAQRMPERRFLIGGSGWEPHQLSDNIHSLGHVYTHQHNAVNSSALAVLNISRESMARYGHSPATRVFEAAGAGACLITDAWEGIAEFLEPGREVLVARDGAEVAALLEGLTPDRAHAIGEAARWRVLMQHTYANRAALVEGVLTGRACATLPAEAVA